MGTASTAVSRLKLFLSFAKIGLFTFGGGYAMISLIEAECVEKRKWITHDEMMDITVIAESTPGPIAINCATYVGYKRGGLPGAVLTTLGVVLPSFIIIYLISVLFDDFLSIPLIASAFKGIKAAVGLLILKAAAALIQKMRDGIFDYAVVLLSCVAMLIADIFSLNISSVYIILTTGVIGLAVFFVKAKLKHGGEDSE